ncbi:MAG TPA: 30S ribosome-binding factor RbfA [Terriglobales bacterium]|nr:30S ribosome-binding factor RbfA [Terriglobales bacterium]
MIENRGAAHHRERMAEALKEQITIILEGELADPRIGLCNVSEIVYAPGGKSARVLVQVEGTEEEQRETIEGLTAARAYIRTSVRDAIGKRHVPELTFHLDRSEQLGGRINELLDRVEKRARKVKRTE